MINNENLSFDFREILKQKAERNNAFMQEELTRNAKKKRFCVGCGQEIYREDFINQISIDEWIISGFCQFCQDEIFGKQYNKTKRINKNEYKD